MPPLPAPYSKRATQFCNKGKEAVAKANQHADRITDQSFISKNAVSGMPNLQVRIFKVCAIHINL